MRPTNITTLILGAPATGKSFVTGTVSCKRIYTRANVLNAALTLVGALGASLAAYLGWLKALDLPCVSSGCGAVLNSSYGMLLGLPTGYIGLIFWAALFLPLSFPRRVAALFLCVGSLGFMYIQFLVLEGFCAFCTAHAALAVVASILVWRDARPLVGGLVIPLILPFPLLAIQQHQLGQQQMSAPLQTRTASALPPSSEPDNPTFATQAREDHVRAVEAYASRPTQPISPQGAEGLAAVPAPALQPPVAPRQSASPSAPGVVTQTRTLPTRSSILPSAIPAAAAIQWLGTASDAQSTPLLVLSLTCHHCIDTLFASLRHPQLGTAHGPKILFSVAPQNFELHQYILAATLIYDNPADGFTAVFSQLAPMRDMVISNNVATVKAYLVARFPRLSEKLATAQHILVEQERVLQPLNIVATPAFIQPNGIMQYHVEPSDILFL